MVKILNMQFMRYANLFSRVTRIRTNHCFEYNNAIVFAVPRALVSRALGPDNQNLRRLNQVIGRKVKIVAIPHGREDIENFVSVITYPVKFKINCEFIHTSPKNIYVTDSYYIVSRVVTE